MGCHTFASLSDHLGWPEGGVISRLEYVSGSGSNNGPKGLSLSHRVTRNDSSPRREAEQTIRRAVRSGHQALPNDIGSA